MKRTEIFFPFEPKPKGRPRFTRTGHAYTPPATQEYEKAIREYYKELTEDYYDSAIGVRLVFNMPIPQSASKKKQKLMEDGKIKCTKHNGDADNLTKAILDSINGIAFSDDSLITELYVKKKYSTTPGTEMIIYEDVD